jgi:chromosome segregation ATPase
MSGILNYLRGRSSSSPVSSPAQPNQPPPDFDYSNIDTIPVSLRPTFDNLKKAINAKKNILEQYKGLNATLQSMDGLLDSYISNHASTTQELDELKTAKERLENERDNLNNQPRTNPEDQAKIADLNQKIADKQSEIDQLNEQQSLNINNMTAINKLLDEATTYINNMYPRDNTEITNIQRLIDQMKGKLQGSQVAPIDNEFEFDDVYNPNPKIVDGNRKGGYRYSSSQMRRKSTARRSSSSRSSSSKRRRNKKRTARKNMLGGKRMKKTKSKFTKRKNHKKH